MDQDDDDLELTDSEQEPESIVPFTNGSIFILKEPNKFTGFFKLTRPGEMDGESYDYNTFNYILAMIYPDRFLNDDTIFNMYESYRRVVLQFQSMTKNDNTNKPVKFGRHNNNYSTSYNDIEAFIQEGRYSVTFFVNNEIKKVLRLISGEPETIGSFTLEQHERIRRFNDYDERNFGHESYDSDYIIHNIRFDDSKKPDEQDRIIFIMTYTDDAFNDYGYQARFYMNLKTYELNLVQDNERNPIYRVY